jgi:mRNA interferase MazF
MVSGDIVDLDLGIPKDHKARFRHSAVVVTAQRIVNANPSVIQVVPLTSTIRAFDSEIIVEPDATNGLPVRSAAQCQHIRAVALGRITAARCTVGPAVLA